MAERVWTPEGSQCCRSILVSFQLSRGELEPGLSPATGTQGSRDSGVQGSRHSGIQGFRDSGIQGFSDPGVQGSMDPGI